MWPELHTALPPAKLRVLLEGGRADAALFQQLGAVLGGLLELSAPGSPHHAVAVALLPVVRARVMPAAPRLQGDSQVRRGADVLWQGS